MDKLFEKINQEFKAQGRRYRGLPNFGVCCKELGVLKAMSFRVFVRSFCSVESCTNFRYCCLNA